MNLHGADVIFDVAGEAQLRHGVFEEVRVFGPVGIVADRAVPQLYGAVDILFFSKAVAHEAELLPWGPEIFAAYECAFALVA